MPRLIFVYLGVFALSYLLVYFLSKKKIFFRGRSHVSPRHRFKSKLDKGLWVQVYDTDLLDDAKQVMARIEEEDIECILYEQGRKDIHGNPMKGFGIAVPRTSIHRAQTLISRLPV